MDSFRAIKRAIPTVKFYATNTGVIDTVFNATVPSQMTVTSVLQTSVSRVGYPNTSVNSNVGHNLYAHWTADAEL